MSATLRQRCADIPGVELRVQRYTFFLRCANKFANGSDFLV